MRRKPMSRRQRIDASREARLWITSIVAPIATLMLARPDIAHKVKDKALDIKDWAADKFNNLADKFKK